MCCALLVCLFTVEQLTVWVRKKISFVTVKIMGDAVVKKTMITIIA